MKIAGRSQANPDQLEDLSVQVDIIALVHGLTEDRVLSLPLEDYQRFACSVRFLMDSPRQGDPRRVAVGGYHLPLNGDPDGLWLIPCKSPREMTTAQYIDFQTFATMSEREGNAAKWLALILSCFLVPKGKAYCDGYDVAEVQDAIRQSLSVQDALDLIAFFLRKCAKLMRDIATSSARTLRTKARKNPKTLQRTTAPLESGGDGRIPWMK